MTGGNRSLLPLLTPRSVAVIGASADPAKFSGRIFPCLVRHGYTGALFPINARQAQIMGHKAYPDLASVPSPVDCVVYSIGAAGIGPVLQACEEKGGVRLLVVTSAGFAERGDEEGRRLQQQLTDFARRTGTRVIGPNCIGFFNPVDSTALAAAAVLEWPEFPAGRIGLISQSGGLAFGTLLIGAHEKGIAFSRIVTTGNEADTDLVEWSQALIDDDETDAICLTIEGVRDGAAFQRFLARARHVGKPVVILKCGRTALGETMVMSHTGAVAGSQAVFEAVCAHHGATLVEDLDELYEIAQMFSKLRRSGKLAAGAPKHAGARAGATALSISGGHIGLFADLASQAGVRFADLSAATQDALAVHLQRPAPILNPVDLTGGTVSDPALWGRCVQTLLQDADVDIVVPILTIAKNYDSVSRDLLAQAESQRKTVLVIWAGSAREGLGKAMVRESLVPIFDSQRSGARGAAALTGYWQCGAVAQLVAGPQSQDTGMRARLLELAKGRAVVGEEESKQILQRIGFTLPRESQARDLQQALTAAQKIGYPVVLKGIHPDIAHKSDAGLVQLDLRTPQQLEAAYSQIMASMHKQARQSSDAFVLVQEMAAGGIELLLGVRRDPTFGPAVVFGLGGIYVEIFKDVAVRPAPITHSQARAMMDEVAAIGLLKGARGRRPADLDAIAALLVALGDFAVAQRDLVREVEVNPLIVLNRDEDSLRAVDALIVFDPQASPAVLSSP